MRTYIEAVEHEARAAMRRTQDLLATGGIDAQMRRMATMGPGLMESYGRAARDAVKALGGMAAVRQGFDRLATTTFGTATPRTTARTYPVTVEERQEPEPEPDSAPAPQTATAERPAARSFILQQMIEAKDEAAQAACCRYILRNRLLG